MDFKYEIGGRTFYQKPLVLGQVKQLVSVLKGLVLPYDLTINSLILTLGDKIPQTIAILLSEEGVLLKNKNVDEIQELVEENLDIAQTIKVIEDFFDCNPIASISEAVIGLSLKVKSNMTQATSLTESSLSLLEETSPKEMTSLGDTPLENANPM